MFRMDKSIQTESGLRFPGAGEEGWGVVVNGHETPFWRVNNVLNLGCDGCTAVITLKIIELYLLNG